MKNLFIGLIFVLFATAVNAGALATLTSTPQDDKGRTETPELEVPKVDPLEPQVPQVYILPSLIDCGPPVVVSSIINRYQELPFLRGETVIKRPDGVLMQAGMTMYLNATTGTYSVVAEFPGNVFWCIINSGGKVVPSVPGKKT
tara:strand:+ start:2122 stop:2553 length:432 start_codon:yes stop_codon:yes gene_type:complete